MTESGEKINNMEWELKRGLMEHSMKENIKMGKNMVLANFVLLTVANIEVILVRMKFVAMGVTNGQIKRIMLVSGVTTKWKEMGF